MRVGVLLVLAGAFLLVAYGVYEGMRVLFGDPDVPLAVRAGVPLVVAGVVVALGKAAWDRRQARAHAHPEIEEAQP